MQGIYGHREARALLERAARSGQVAHAYLFAGPSGIGKTALALEFARLLQCTGRGPTDAEPCGACGACIRIAHGTYPDVSVVEPAPGKRTLEVDIVRNMLRAASLAPSEGTHRIFIVPEIERMVPVATNTILKTLEEPPPGVVLLLTTADLENLLPTILSRCQIVPMHALTPDEAQRALAERWTVPDAEARALAGLANGRLGWAVRAHENPALRERRAEELETIAALATAPRDEQLRKAGALAPDNETARRTVELWMLWWRDVVLSACGADHLATTGEPRQRAERLGRALGRERAQPFLESLLRAQRALEANGNPRLTLEVLALDLPRAPGARTR